MRTLPPTESLHDRLYWTKSTLRSLITIDANVRGGVPCFTGSSVTVALVLHKLGKGSWIIHISRDTGLEPTTISLLLEALVVYFDHQWTSVEAVTTGLRDVFFEDIK